MDPSALNLTTITGIVAIAMLIVEFLKRILKNKAWFSKIPICIYAVVITAAIAFFANHTIHKLPGNTLCVVWQAVLAAASASGLYTWLKNPESPQTASNISVASVIPTPAPQLPPQNSGGDSNVQVAKSNPSDCVSDGPITVNVRVRRGRSSTTINCTSGK